MVNPSDYPCLGGVVNKSNSKATSVTNGCTAETGVFWESGSSEPYPPVGGRWSVPR